jgi:AcrR family transcriptional regulator
MLDFEAEFLRGIAMPAQTAEIIPLPEQDNDKRRQIIKGASEVFLAKGFDAGSMAEIARTAGVSKGTLYVYFKNKEELFDAIVSGACQLLAAQAFVFDDNDHDVAANLTRVGKQVAEHMCSPEVVSSLRTVIAISARMTELGRSFYTTGPARTVALLKAYLEAQNAAGVLAVDDCEVAAAQFIDSVVSTTFKPVLFNFDPPTPERIDYVVGVAVRVFLAAYRK